jgi:hypothetical protein
VDGFHQEAEEVAPYTASASQPAEAPVEASRADERAGESAPKLPDEDEDLESFQAWLRSLKR